MNKLNIKKRSLEKKTHELRDIGVVPGTIYGPTIKNTAIKITRAELSKAMNQSGEVYLVMSGRGPVFVKFEEIQRDPVSNDLLHFSLVQLPKGVENEVDIPVNLKGTPVGVRKGGTLVVMKNEITISGKPRSIPEKVEANVSKLDIGDKLTVDDLNIPKKVDAMEDDSEVVAICKPPVKEVPILTKEAIEVENKIISKDSLSFPAQAI